MTEHNFHILCAVWLQAIHPLDNSHMCNTKFIYDPMQQVCMHTYHQHSITTLDLLQMTPMSITLTLQLQTHHCKCAGWVLQLFDDVWRFFAQCLARTQFHKAKYCFIDNAWLQHWPSSTRRSVRHQPILHPCNKWSNITRNMHWRFVMLETHAIHSVQRILKYMNVCQFCRAHTCKRDYLNAKNGNVLAWL